MTSARIKQILFGWVEDFRGERRHQRGQGETFEPHFIYK